MGVRTEVRGAAAIVTLDWPEKRNAMGPEQMTELVGALRLAIASEPTGIVLTGNGAFCAGADLTRLAERAAMTESERRALVTDHAQPMITTVVGAPCPVFAALDGPALGLGFDLALACDERFFGPDGWCMQGWGRAGVISALGGILFLQRLHPTALWKLLAEQRRIAGTEAASLQLGEAVAEGSALDAAVARIDALASLPAGTLRAYVELQRAPVRSALEEHLARCADVQGRLLGDPDLGARALGLLRLPSA